MSTAASRTRRKRLGQFFSGVPLGRVLAALSGASDARAIIDPMGGSGDLLAACLLEGATPRVLAAIEIDPRSADTCHERLTGLGAEATVVRGDAFDWRSWPGAEAGWDLAITNPPYVRYQVGSSEAAGGVPGAARVRDSLLEWLLRAAPLGGRDRRAFSEYARGYSGLADLAVPAWIMCAASLSVGGRLAVVAPPTWLSREYAAPVLHMLRRYFEIEYAVEDADGSWFPDALVRPTLIVARRVADKGGAHKPGGHLRISLAKRAGGGTSFVGGAFPDEARPETAFAAWARELRRNRRGGVRHGIRASWSGEADLLLALNSHGLRLTGEAAFASTKRLLPERMTEVLGETPTLATLADLGWRTGQGLRTGANDFFYVRTGENGTAKSALLLGKPLLLPSGAVRAAVRRQADLPKGTHAPADAGVGVLVLEDWALRENIMSATGPRPWREMRDDLDRLVRAAAVSSRGGAPLPELSAVRANVRAGRPGRPARFWYQLPPLTQRHTPTLYVPRVNSARPIARLNPGRALVVDANFATLWPEHEAISPEMMLALLNSAWTHCFLELTATVLGGGALKVEAAHLRRLLFPRTDAATATRLHALGGELAGRGTDPDLAVAIDGAMLHAAAGRGADGGSLRALARSLIGNRTRRPTDGAAR